MFSLGRKQIYILKKSSYGLASWKVKTKTCRTKNVYLYKPELISIAEIEVNSGLA